MVERLLSSSPGLEIWWDSSPLVFGDWVAKVVAAAPRDGRARLQEQLSRLFVVQDAARSVFRGCTTNPSLSLAAVRSAPDYWNRRIDECIADNPGIGLEELSWRTYKAVILRSAEMLRPIWEATGGQCGFVSGQLDPRLVTDTEAMCRQGAEIAGLAPNVMVKVPASQEGMEVARRLTASGISTNVTTCFTLPQIMAAARATRQGLEIARSSGVDTSRCRSVISYFLARLVERPELLHQAERLGVEVSDADRKWFGIAVFKRAYELLREGGYPSKLLLCSFRKGPAVNGAMRFWDIEEFSGGDIILTLPPLALELLFELDGNLVFDPDAIHRRPPRTSLDKMLKLPYCFQAYEPDGLPPEEFSSHPGMVDLLTQFCKASAALETHMGQRLALPGLTV